jgi:hypothetical protein
MAAMRFGSDQVPRDVSGASNHATMSGDQMFDARWMARRLRKNSSSRLSAGAEGALVTSLFKEANVRNRGVVAGRSEATGGVSPASRIGVGDLLTPMAARRSILATMGETTCDAAAAGEAAASSVSGPAARGALPAASSR